MPKIVDPALERRRIAAAAIGVIGEAGFEGTRLRDVAHAAHATTGAVMHYFDGKDAVVEAALEEVVRRTLERIDSLAAREKAGGLPALLVRLSRYLPLDEEGRAEWRVWLAFWGRAIADERLRSIHQRHYRGFVDRMVASLEALDAASPRRSRRDLVRIADALIAAIDGIGTRATLEPDLWPARRQRETLDAAIRPLLSEFHGRTENAAGKAPVRRKETKR